jgi:glucose/arabinose dehydrogenase
MTIVRIVGVVIGAAAALMPAVAHGAVLAPTPTATPLVRVDARPSAATRVRPSAAPTRAITTAVAGRTGAASGLVLDPIPSPIVVGASNTVTGTGFTAGSRLLLFVNVFGAVQTYGPFTPSSASATALGWTVPASVAMGSGFATVLVVNTDQGFIQSNPASQYLFGSAAANIPTITSINGVDLRPLDQAVPVATVETVMAVPSTVTIGGTGFNNPKVNLFTAGGFIGPLDPLPGAGSTQIQVQIPGGAATGPGTFQVVNQPYSSQNVSNAVTATLGAAPTITAVTQNGSTVTVQGTGFSSLSVINLFNLQGGTVSFIGGLWPTNGRARIPLTAVTPTQFTFAVPPDAITGPAYVQVVNPPFTPFATSDSDPDGAFTIVQSVVPPGGSSLRFFGTGSNDIDRVKIALGDVPPGRPVDVDGDFTLEWWMQTAAGNDSGACVPGGSNWRSGNIIFDRDVFGAGDDGEYGISLFGSGGTIAFGVDRQGTGTTVCGAANVADGMWHHVAVTRGGSTLRIFVDGQLDASTASGPTGAIGYRNGRATTHPADPFLVIGAEKHDLGAGFPSYHGWIDEVRLSNVVRYGGAFTRPSAPFASDANTVALYHFDEGNGDVVVDTASAVGGPSNGVRRVGGVAQGPQWSTATPFTSTTPVIALQPLSNALTAPTSITHCGDNRLFITEQAGTIRIWDGTQLLATPFLSVAGVSSGGERGLLSVAFHPRYAVNGLFFVYYTDASGNPTIARYHVSADPNVADPNSRAVLLSVPHPGAANHNGGQLQFGPDGYLYAGFGDGGGGCDDTNGGCNAQADDRLLGKIIRIDVDQNAGSAPFYGIPPTNPFAAPGNPRDEIWAKGVRNPWRFSFDRLTGSLFIADVGQSTREEVDYQAAGDPGGENYGWKIMEGFACNTCALTGCVSPPPCNSPLLTPPILDYDHSLGCAITGGYVYRGTRVAFLRGKYLFGDLCSGRIWWAVQNGGTWMKTQFGPTLGNLYSFGQDVFGEQYVAGGDGTLTKIVQGP